MSLNKNHMLHNLKMLNKILVVLAVALMFGLAGLVVVRAATQVNLVAADDFAVLAGSFITDSNPAAGIITGDVGLSPAAGTFYTGLTSAQVSGTIYAVDATGPDGAPGNNPTLLSSAKSALTSAYANALAQTTTGVISADLGGQTLTPGVYEDNDAPDSLGITGTLTLNAQGDPDAVFIFKTGSTLTTAASSNVALINGAQACNVFWQVGSSATLGTGTLFKGNILALASITDAGGSTVEGRLLARNGAVTLNNTTVTKATCVVPPPTPSTPPVSAGSSSFQLLPLISVTKSPNPLALPGGPGPVTYTYTAANVGPVPMSNVWVKDNKCNSGAFLELVAGDINGDSKLDTTETWKYSCTKTVSQTETNTATARGFYSGWDAFDTANATVVVGKSITPPLIHLVKKPNVFVLPVGGGAVTYTYTVTNPGTATLSDVSVVDNKCTGLPGRVVGHPGDLNKNNLLESNETWSFTCQTNLTQTTTNIGTAEGSANGLTAIDFSSATVAVAVPGLPNAGLPPEEKGTPWATIFLAGIFGALILSYFIQRRSLKIDSR